MRQDRPARGSNKGQRHGRGRGGYRSTQKTGMPSLFKTARIEERASSDAEFSDGIPAQTMDSEDNSSGYSNDEEEQELDKAQTRPYNMLLQHLATTLQPQHKKRKRNVIEETEYAENLESDTDLVEVSEDLENLEADDLIDSEDEVGPQRGNFGSFKSMRNFTNDSRLQSI